MNSGRGVSPLDYDNDDNFWYILLDLDRVKHFAYNELDRLSPDLERFKKRVDRYIEAGRDATDVWVKLPRDRQDDFGDVGSNYYDQKAVFKHILSGLQEPKKKFSKLEDMLGLKVFVPLERRTLRRRAWQYGLETAKDQVAYIRKFGSEPPISPAPPKNDSRIKSLVFKNKPVKIWWPDEWFWGDYDYVARVSWSGIVVEVY